MKTAHTNITLAQASYKSDFDRQARPIPQGLKPGDMVYLCRETPGDGTHYKLKIKVSGPLKVLKKSSYTIMIINNKGLEDTVSLDHVV